MYRFVHSQTVRYGPRSIRVMAPQIWNMRPSQDQKH